ncbi:TonB-dependent receptor [Sphingomonas endophytica]|uniref:TonB-dependent receptor n=1 Tax=Sphingomonas endophytica TaxID=869719 RepID=A0A147I293_9SPHN|nr:TonB-dependent receptor [Sphingomonas endophytica]KTT71760.1 TonB-dependent receptor [Sphingomonas endophytica]
MRTIVRRSAVRAALLSAVAATGLTAAPAVAQTQPTGPGGQVPSPATQVDTAANPDAQVPQSAVQSIEDATDSSQPAQDIVVTGIRASLQSATNAKRNSVGFGDSIFAEDIGKLPATNLAETLNRIPGVRLNRDISGEGTQVSIRGLGPSFSKVLLNGTQFAVASDGGTNGSGGGNREVDLDFFPSELFTRLDVLKSPTASTLEGGIAGTVNLRNARPFDKPGTHLTVVAQGAYSDTNDKFGPRGAIVASHTFGDTFGVLLGVAGVRQKTRVDGYDTIGFTDANLPICAGGSAACNPGGNGFSFASTVPAGVGRGLVTGAPIDLVATSGLPLSQLATAIIPRLGRPSLTEGTRERISVVGSMEWRPSDALHFALDGIYAKSKRDYIRSNMNWQVRNSGPGTSPQSTGGMVPFDIKVDSNNVVTSGIFANSSFFSENSIFNQDTDFWNVTPSASWKPNDRVKVDLSANWGKSTFFREQPTFAFQTRPNSGIEVNYDNKNGNPQPLITPNVDLGDPNLGWQWYRVNVQNVRRKTETRGAHLDVYVGDETVNVKFGAAYDQAQRSIRAYDNTNPFQLSVCGNPCTGNTGSVPTASLAQYLMRSPIDNFGHLSRGGFGFTSFIMPDIEALKQATNYASFRDSAPETRGSVTGGATGDIDEKVFGGYAEVNGVSEVFGRELRANAGVRYTYTKQKVVGPSQIGTAIVDITARSNYEEVLPSANLSYDLFRNVKLRFAVSKSMTRPDASSILPGVTFSDPSAQVASAGNPALQPYTSDNVDLGGEFYTGGAGYIGVALFRKSINGFTATVQQQTPFADLNIPVDALQATQRQALLDRAAAAGVAPGAVAITVNRPINLNNLVIKGVEGTWNQPLDFAIKGLGFQANGTHITQSSDTGLVAPGVPKWGYNVQGYYENYGLSLSLNYVWQGGVIAANAPQNNLNVPLEADARGQLDLSAGYQLPFMDKAFRLTLDVLNITNTPIRTTIGYDNATYNVFYPGRQVLVGVRASF